MSEEQQQLSMEMDAVPARTRKVRAFAVKASQYGKQNIAAGNDPFMEMMARDISECLEASDDPRAQSLLRDLQDPKKGESVLSLIRKHGFTVGEIHGIWKQFHRAIAAHEIYRQIQSIAKNTAEAARLRPVVCPGCDGKQEIQGKRKGGRNKDKNERSWYTCPECDGIGSVNRPDSHAVDRAFKATGMIMDGANINVNIGHYEPSVDHLEEIDKMSAINVTVDPE